MKRLFSQRGDSPEPIERGREETSFNPENLLKNKDKRKTKKIVLVSLFSIVGLFLVLGLLIGIPAISFVKQVRKIEAKAREVQASLSSRDLELIEKKLEETENELNTLEKSYQRLVIIKFLPILRNYYLDGQKALLAADSGLKTGHIVVEAVKPYQDFLGLKSATESAEIKDGGQTTEERINFLVESIEGLRPRLDEIEKELATIEENIGAINPNRYPVKIKSVQLRENIIQGQRTIKQLGQFFEQGRPLIEKADWLLGKDEPRNYFFFFQNDAELRPTGGFWTAYGILNVDNGDITPAKSDDIYALDNQFNSSIPAPRPIEEYHKKVYYWYLRDMNLSPSFPTSVEQFNQYYQDLSGAVDFDAVFAVDTEVLVDILNVLGRIGVPGWGNFGPEPDDRCWGCPQVVYQLELLADKPVSTTRLNRKGFLAPLMHSILANAMGSPKETVVQLANVLFENLKEKHILIYFPDEELQRAAEGLNISGTFQEAKEDYFYLNDCNFAGAKSNLFINQEIKQDYRVENGKIIKKVTVDYKNSAPASNCNLEAGQLCLNGLYRDWFRFYVPQGSKLIKMTGTEVEPVVYEEEGKTVFEGFYGNKYPLHPQGSSRITVEYELPFEPKKIIELLIQKQPGTKSPQHTILVKGDLHTEIELTEDQSVTVSL